MIKNKSGIAPTGGTADTLALGVRRNNTSAASERSATRCCFASLACSVSSTARAPVCQNHPPHATSDTMSLALS